MDISRNSGHEVGTVKILILGDTSVGKSSLVLRYIKDDFSLEHSETLGVDFRSKFITIKGEQYLIQVWDTAGQEKYNNITRTYYKRASGIIIAFDSMNQKSFDNVQNWLNRVWNEIDSSVPIILTATKIDIENKDIVTQGKALAKDLHLKFFETSAKDKINIDKLFLYLIEEVLENKNIRYSGLNSVTNNSLTISKFRKLNKNRKCCQ